MRSQIHTTNLDVATDVAVTFLEAVARQRLITVAEATVKSEELHLDQARRFVAAQAKDPIEVAQAQARAANARSALATARSDAAVALANLQASARRSVTSATRRLGSRVIMYEHWITEP